MASTASLSQPRSVPRFRLQVPPPFQLVTGTALAIFIVGLAYPLFRAALQVFWRDGALDLSAFGEVAAMPEALESIPTTAFVVACTAGVATTVGGLLSYLNERTDVRMGLLTDVFPFLPFLVPAIAGSIGWVALLAPNIGFANVWLAALLGLSTGPFNIYTLPGLIFVYVIYCTPYAFLMITAGLRNMDPQLEEQSRMCGAGWWRTFRKVLVPSMAPTFVGALLLVTWEAIGMVSVPAAIASAAHIPILSIQILHLLAFDFPPRFGPALVLSLALLAMIGAVWFVQAQVRRLDRFAKVGGRGASAPRLKLGVWKWPIRAVVLLYIGIVFLLPVTALLLIALRGFWTPQIQLSQLSLDHFNRLIFGNSSLFLAFTTSMRLSAIVATVGILIAATFSVFVVTNKSRAVDLLDAMLKLPVIVPHIVIGIGFVLAFAGAPFYLSGSFMMLVVCFLLIRVPVGTLTTDGVAAQVGVELAEASRMSGASGFRTLRKVYLPLMYPGMAVGWALLFVTSLGDLELSAIISGTANPTIGATILRAITIGDYAVISALAVMLVAINGTIVSTIVLLSGRRGRQALSGRRG